MAYQPIQDLVTGSGNLTAAAQTVTLSGLRGTGDATISITGTWTGTLTIQGSIDGGTTYANLNAAEIDTFTVYQSSTWSRNAQLRVNSIAGLSHLRVYATVLSSGTAVVSVRATNNSATTTTLNYLSLASDTPQFAARELRLVDIQQHALEIGNLDSLACIRKHLDLRRHYAAQRLITQRADFHVQSLAGDFALDPCPPRSRQAGAIGPPQQRARRGNRGRHKHEGERAQVAGEVEVIHAGRRA